MMIRSRVNKTVVCLFIISFFHVMVHGQMIQPQELKPLSNFQGFPSGSIYQNVNLAPELRARNVINYLSFDEKLSLTTGILGFCFPGIPRLGLRAVVMADASQGIRLSSIQSDTESVSFPSMQALAATWNPKIALDFGTAMGEQCKLHGVDVLLGPGINMQRTSEGGRNYEYMGEDPLLTSKIAVAYVKGIQAKGIVATAKHFICNDQEFVRHIASSDVSERTLREIYLPPWKALIEQAGLRAIMTGNNLVNSIPNTMNKPLLNDILRDEYHFKGLAMTDWQNTNYYPFQQYLVPISGISLLMPENKTFANYIKSYLTKYPDKLKKIENELNDMISYNLYTFFEAGIYDRGAVDVAMAKKVKLHEKLAEQCADESICLLKNEQDILPVSVRKKILLTGLPEIYSGKGSGFVKGFNHVDFESGLRSAYGNNLISEPKPTDEQIQKADVVIFRLSKEAGEGYDVPFIGADSSSTTIQKLCRLNKNVIVLVSSGNGIEMPWIQSVKGVLWTFMLGQQRGAALANVITGKVNPSGKLPFTLEKDIQDSPAPEFNFLGGKPYWHGSNRFYKDYWKGTDTTTAKIELAKYVKPNQLVHIPYTEGVFMGYRWYEKYNKPIQFCFGYGLSYTQFEFKNLKISRTSIPSKDSLIVSLQIRNSGKARGAEVVQLYLSDVKSSVERPLKELKGFQKIYLRSGEQQTIKFVIHPEDLAFWDENKNAWNAEPGDYEIMIGNSSQDIKLKHKFKLL
ncbi:Beta-glucosidase [Arcticibacter svalbardensis MN12-7]|uniref:Beta-glucosidase n=1 Tax=Arcticibacter svalbardensis MN12-7 TaxID=1150600 RepID=R9GRA7_9SPHI|nr:glycoside hydrolase family 3 C-terminal domain-containing protein [Arcticibacter svalbardensis]EOR94218.1 Beta-glucosidase [Arcticibacter svalbardensis MN12-7]